MKNSVCVIGLGHVGLPLAALLANRGVKVLGVDTDPVVVEQLQQGLYEGKEPGLQQLVASAKWRIREKVERAAVYLIAVPTPLRDLSHVEAAVEAIAPFVERETLVLIESTCPVGTSEWVAKKLDCQVAYCPERVLPGQIVQELIETDRVVGGVTEEATERAATFYEQFVRGTVRKTHARVAEAVKLAENAFRDVNIAFANELSMVAEGLGIEVNEWIDLANHHPRVNILRPGVGVGGQCIAVDPWFLIEAVPEKTGLMQRARAVNLAKTEWVVEQVRATGARCVACLGLTYKPDVADWRHSPALKVIEALEEEREVLRVDPHVPGSWEVEEAIERAELVVGLVAHREFLGVDLRGKPHLDFARVFG